MKKNRTDKALFLDKTLMGFLVFVCAFLRLFFNRQEPFEKNKVQRIVVAKFVGLGSILILQNFFKRLRQEFPNAHVTFLTFSENKFLAELMKNEVDECLLVQTQEAGTFLRSSWQISQYLREQNIDLYFDCEFFSRYSAVFGYLCQARNSVGFLSKKLKLRATLYSFKCSFDASIHVIENYFHYFDILGLKQNNASHHGKAAELSIVAEPSLTEKLRQMSLGGKKFIVFNPSASDALGGYRKWPTKHWSELIETTFREGYEGHILLTGLASDKETIERIIKELGPFEYSQRVYNTAGMFSLKEYLNLLKMAQMTVTVDSGTAHFSVALKTPTVILFGPETPVLYGYDESWCRNVYLALECSPCGNILDGKKVHCHNENRCMKSMSVPLVRGAMKELVISNES